MRDFKLKIDLLPKGAWDNDLSKTLPKKDWDTIRNKCYEKANHKCQICGYETDDLDAHEVWEFDVKNKTQTLKDIIAICTRCHGVIHMRNSQRIGYGENARRHFMKTNNANELDFAAHYTEAQMIFEERNFIYHWDMIVDLEKFGGKGMEFKEIKRKKIKNPYIKHELIDLKNASDLFPRVLGIEVNNYNGSIKVQCDKTNKIEWYVDNEIVKTKYNFGRKFVDFFSIKGLNDGKVYFKLCNLNGCLNSKTFVLEGWE